MLKNNKHKIKSKRSQCRTPQVFYRKLKFLGWISNSYSYWILNIFAGNNGYHPMGWPLFCHPCKPEKRSCKFLHNYHLFKERAIDWPKEALVPMKKFSASNSMYEIHLKNIGLIPNYTGYVPGAKYRYSFGYCFGGFNNWVYVKFVFIDMDKHFRPTVLMFKNEDIISSIFVWRTLPQCPDIQDWLDFDFVQ